MHVDSNWVPGFTKDHFDRYNIFPTQGPLLLTAWIEILALHSGVAQSSLEPEIVLVGSKRNKSYLEANQSPATYIWFQHPLSTIHSRIKMLGFKWFYRVHMFRSWKNIIFQVATHFRPSHSLLNMITASFCEVLLVKLKHYFNISIDTNNCSSATQSKTKNQWYCCLSHLHVYKVASRWSCWIAMLTITYLPGF